MEFSHVYEFRLKNKGDQNECSSKVAAFITNSQKWRTKIS